tara:strand:+ start:220 stop:528 length:309 start_codon:yes stop_codon:yes gene_type:complete
MSRVLSIIIFGSVFALLMSLCSKTRAKVNSLLFLILVSWNRSRRVSRERIFLLQVPKKDPTENQFGFIFGPLQLGFDLVEKTTSTHQAREKGKKKNSCFLIC